MQKRIIAAAVIVAGTVGLLVASAVSTSALPVLTVDQLVNHKGPAKASSAASAVRLGARVTEAPIDYQTSPTPPEFRLSFVVRDIAVPESQMKVVYLGIMPDTLKAGRDVILEGTYDGSTFRASEIKTQCPSKYEPPVPGKDGSKSGSGAVSY